MTDEQLIENLRARTWPGDCEAAAFRIEELLARVAELEGESFAWRDKCMFQSGQMESLKEEATFLASERAEREKQEPVAWYIDGEDGREYNGTPKMSGGRTGAPLYAAPPVAAPARLTDSDNHANELRRMARKVGHPAGDIPAVMHSAATHIEDLVRRLREAEGRLHEVATHCANVEFALREVRESLQFANDSLGGPIMDTIWMMHRPETLFDFIDSTLQPPEAGGEK